MEIHQQDVQQQDERLRRKRGPKPSALDARRREIAERSGAATNSGGNSGRNNRPPSIGSDNEWLDKVAVEDVRETEKMSEMYAKNSSLAARFAAMKGGG